jgi:hypothetical protein
MRIDRAMERSMGMDDATWARHANPWSGWTRVPILPLAALAIWARVWIGWWCLVPLAALIVFARVNPRLFPPPGHLDAWMSRGVLGERLWLARRSAPIPRHHAVWALVLSTLAGLGLIPLGFGLIVLDVGWTLFGLTLSVGAKMWFIDRMVWLHDTRAAWQRP